MIELVSANGESRHSLLTPLTYALLPLYSYCRCQCCCGFWVSQHTWKVILLTIYTSHLPTVVIMQSFTMSLPMWMLLWCSSKSVYMNIHITGHSYFSLTSYCRHAVIVDVVLDVVVMFEPAGVYGESRYWPFIPLTYTLLSSCIHFQCRCRCGYCCDVQVDQRIWIFMSLANYPSHLQAVVVM